MTDPQRILILKPCLKKRCSHISCMQSIRPESAIATASKLFLVGGL